MKLRSELKRLHLDLRATTVYVTHDQVEALALSNRIVVMDEEVIQQVGSPCQLPPPDRLCENSPGTTVFLCPK